MARRPDAATWDRKISTKRVLIHALLTYEYFAMIKELHDQGATTWTHPATWTDVPFPLALIALRRDADGPVGGIGEMAVTSAIYCFAAYQLKRL